MPVHRKFTLDPATGEAIELYRNCERYITVSGFVADLPTCPVLAPLDDFFDKLLARFDGGGSGSSPVPVSSGSTSTTPVRSEPQIDYEDLIQNGAPMKASAARNSPGWSGIWQVKASRPRRSPRSSRGIPTASARNTPAGCRPKSKRSYGKWQTHKRASATGSPATGGAPWPQIRVVAGELPHVVNEAEDGPAAARPRDLSARRARGPAGAHRPQRRR